MKRVFIDTIKTRHFDAWVAVRPLPRMGKKPALAPRWLLERAPALRKLSNPMLLPSPWGGRFTDWEAGAVS